MPRNIHGIFHDYNVGYMLDVWAARKMCKHVFASLWGTDELLCSFDGISFVPKGTKWPDVNACWYHVDQGVSKQGLRCIQGRPLITTRIFCICLCDVCLMHIRDQLQLLLGLSFFNVPVP